MREGYIRGYGDRGEERGRGRGVWQRHGGFGGRGDRGGREYGFGCDKDGYGVILESQAVNALRPAHLAHLAQQNSVFVCAHQQGSFGSMKPHDGASCQRGLGRGNGRGFGRGQGFGREGREGQGRGYGPESRGWGGALEARGYGHGREQSCASSDSSSPFQVLSVNIPRGEVAQSSAAFTPRVTVHIESSLAQHLNEQAGVSDPVAADVTAAKKTTVAHIKEHHTVADVVAAGLCTGCGDCVALCGRRQAISMQTHDAGDLVPVVDMSLCNLCGKCYRKCPAILETQSSQH